MSIVIDSRTARIDGHRFVREGSESLQFAVFGII